MPIDSPATALPLPKTHLPNHLDRTLAWILIIIFAVFTSILVLPFDSSWSLPFFPEIVFLGGINAVFFIIYRYLSRSLIHKKEILIDLIKSKYSETISKYEESFEPDSEFWKKYKSFKIAYSKSQPYRFPIEKSDPNVSPPWGPEPYEEHIFNLLYSHHLRNVAFFVEKELEKFRLRDLEQIYKYPTTIDTIYFQRMNKKRPTEPLDLFSRYTYGGIK